MANAAYTLILNSYLDVHRHVLDFVEGLSEENLTFKITTDALPIAFFLWHLARWADHIQASIPGMTQELSIRLPPGRQIWEDQGLSAAWNFPPERMGYAQSGMHMDEEEAARLRFPPKDALLGYVRQAFAAAEIAIQAIDETQFGTLEQPQTITEGVFTPGGTVGDAVLSHLLHDVLHFGMMQNLAGLWPSTPDQ